MRGAAAKQSSPPVITEAGRANDRSGVWPLVGSKSNFLI